MAQASPLRIANDEHARAFERVFENALPRLRRIVAGLGFTPADADDVLQDAFLEIRRRPGEFRDARAAEHWLVRLVVRRGLLEYRRRRRYQRAADRILQTVRAQTPGFSACPETDPARAEEINRMRDALRELDSHSAAILTLRYFCEYDSTEIGEILDLPAATVRGRLRAARLELADRLMRKGVNP